jgi:sarcosine oxidase gamma subunit
MRFVAASRRTGSNRSVSSIHGNSRKKSNNRRSIASPQIRGEQILIEPLEQRQMLSLLGVLPNVPAIPYDGNGSLTYTASTQSFDSSATPAAIIFPDFSVQVIQDPTDFELNVKVNSDGTLQGSGTAPNDLLIAGWIDMNNDGIVDAGDYSGVLLTGTITQFGYQDDGGGVADYDARFTVTGGALDIPGLFQGQDIGLTLTSENSTFVDQNPGDPGFSVDFSGGSKGVVGAIPPLGSFAGVVYNDQNDNGVDDSGEPGINGVTVTLTGTDQNGNPVLQTTTTSTIGGVAGSYNFTQLQPGTYNITETPPAGYLDGSDTAGTAGGTVGDDTITNITIPDSGGGVNETGYNFGNILPSSVSGNVYLDNTGAGTDVGAPGIGGVTITLTGTNDLSQSISETTTTAANGTYSFTGLRPGSYSVTETEPAGYTPAATNPGSLGGMAVAQSTTNVTVSTDQTGVNYNFGQYVPASLAGEVYLDTNGNDALNAGEPGISGVTVTLTGSNYQGSVSETTTTSAGGTYSFSGLVPGTYSLTESIPAGYTGETSNVGSLGGTAAVGSTSTITVDSSNAGVNYNFGQVQPGSISGTVYNDTNGNDVDNSEPGIPGVTVTLSGTTNTGNSVLLTLVSGAGGGYSFAGLLPGTYTVTETIPAGYIGENGDVGNLGGTAGTDVVSNISLSSAQTGTNYNLGQYQPAAISGTVYNDTNGNDVDNSEPGIAGVTVTLTGTNGAGNSVTASTTTAANGTYSFGNLAPGNYTLTETPPAGYVTETANAGSLGGTAAVAVVSNVSVSSGQSGVNYNFGQFQTSSISGTVYNDTNGNDVDNSEPGIAGVTVTLTGTNGLGNAVTATTTSAANGTYSFGGLAPGNYTVTETPPAGYTTEAANAGSLGGSAAVAVVSNVAVSSGQSGVNYNFGQFQTSSISGIVYNDTNGNDVDNSEPGIAGVTVTLTGTNGLGNAVTATTTSAANGSYSFGGLAPGNYTLTEIPPAGYTTETANAGSLGGSAAVAVVSNVSVNSGQTGVNYNFGQYQTSSISGVVYNDTNGNDVDNSEPGIAGVTVTLTGTNGAGNAVTATTTSAANGTYSFGGLAPGNYTVTETPPVGYTTETANAGSLGGTAAVAVVSNVTVTSGETGVNYNFGQYQTSSISGTVYNDTNGNDVDNSEPGIAGVTVTLTGTNGADNSVTATTTSAANGTYSFGGLAPGNYTVTETPPAGYTTETANAGSLGGSAAVAVVSNVSVSSGQSGVNYNFGQYQTSSVSGIVYNDTNGNDVDNSEPGIAGVTVTLTGTNGAGNAVTATTTSAANGTYSFGGLAPGNYKITETPPAGYTTETANAGSLGGTAAVAVVSNVTVISGETGVNYNFGQYQTSSISGTVYNDTNGNDVDNSEPGISGVTVTLTGTNGAGNAVTATTTSAANGTYSFTGLAPGSYTVTETPPAGYLTEAANVGSLGGTGGTAVVSSVTVISGQAGVNYNFGQVLPASLSGEVYIDANSNDVLDSGDTGLSGVTVTLSGTNNLGQAVSTTTTTASNGTYSFTGLRPGSYTITETQPAGYTAETSNAGTLGGTVSVGAVSTVAVLSGNAGTSYNFGEIVPLTDSLSGTVYIDVSGEGLSATEQPLAGDTAESGVVVNLYKDANGNGILDSSDGSPIASVTTGASGTYSFTNLTPGAYIIQEVTPSGYVETAPMLPDYYAETIANGQKITNLNFANYHPCTTTLQNVTYTLSGGGCATTTVTDLRGATAQGETVTVTFTVPSGSAAMQYSLASYNAPDSFFNASDASQQTIFQDATGTFGPGTHTLTVTLPSNYYQVDFVCGAALTQLGPAGSNIFYSAQNRLISADNAGLHDDVDDESATMLFWSSLGQSLIKQFGGVSTNTALGNWLATIYPNLYGGSILGNKTNTTIASIYMSYYNVSGQRNSAQVMATALNVYASTLGLGGAYSTTYGFVPTTDGLGDATFDVGTNGAAFGVANNSTISVTQMLVAVNGSANNGVLYNNVTSLLNDCYNELGQVNGDGTIN